MWRMTGLEVAVLLVIVFVLSFLLVLGFGLVWERASAEEELTLYACPETGTVNMRATPGGRVIGQLARGDSGAFVKTKGEWIYIAILGQEEGGGWVRSEYLTEDIAAMGEYVNASGGRVRIRRSPAGDAWDWLAKDKGVHVTAVRTRDGSLWGYIGKGWVSMDCLVRK